MNKLNLVLGLMILFVCTQAQDKSVFKAYQPGFYQNVIMKDVRNVDESTKITKPSMRFKADLKGVELPNKVDLYKSQWHNAPVSQGNSSTCWAFSTISFFETEVFRITSQKVRLSEIYIVYWQYVEKVKEYIRTRGQSDFGEGSEANAVTQMFKMYGAVPLEYYSGLINGRKYHNHDAMKAEMDTYLKWVKESNAWNEEEIIANVKSIMNYYLGNPPTEVTVNGKKYTPKQYLTEVLKIVPDDYVDLLSYKQEPFYKKVLYNVPDNWWKNEDYYNVPLDEYIKALRSCIENGYTVSIGGDVSEAGFDTESQCAIIPSFDVPSDFINDDARQFRFSNNTTTDDHGIHLVGYTDFKNQRWYLIKDSGAGSKNNDVNAKEFGYYFFREDYVKLKMMNFTVHKDAVKELLKKFN